MTCLTCSSKQIFMEIYDHTVSTTMANAAYCRLCWIDFIKDEMEHLDK